MTNRDIKCSVSSCRHNENSMYCSLSKIQVGSTVINANNQHQTECASFDA